MDKPKNILIFLSQNTHQFILNEIRYAADAFDEVFLVTPYKAAFLEETEMFNNVNYLWLKKENILKKILTALRGVNIGVLKEITRTIRQGKFSLKYVKLLLGYLYDDVKFRSKLKKIINHNKDCNITILSCWFSSPAYSACKLKQKYDDINIVSFAHSYEVDDCKNQFVDNLFMPMKQNSFHLIVFISDNVRYQYVKNHVKPNGWRSDNIVVRYLGTVKRFDGIFDYRYTEGSYRIVTCSNVIKIKRLNLLAEALMCIRDINIEWVHFGNGPEMSDLRSVVALFPSNIVAKFNGSVPNKQVQLFYRNNKVDLFVNTSVSEGIPVSIMEALSYSIPCIATDVGGNGEIVDYDVGELVDCDISAQELSDKIKFFLTDKKRLEICRHNSVKRFEKFNSDTIRPAFYRGLLNNDSNN